MIEFNVTKETKCAINPSLVTAIYPHPGGQQGNHLLWTRRLRRYVCHGPLRGCASEDPGGEHGRKGVRAGDPSG